MKSILHFISYIIHPVFILLYGSLLYFYTTNTYQTYQTIYLYLLQILIVSVFIPLTILYFLIITRKIDSVMIYNVGQRKIPLFIQTVVILFLIFNVVRKDNLIQLHHFFLGILISCFVSLLLVYCKFKASLHMIGISALTTFCISLQIFYHKQDILLIAILIFANGMVASSRLYMKAHSKQELAYGFIIGLLPQCVLMYTVL